MAICFRYIRTRVRTSGRPAAGGAAALRPGRRRGSRPQCDLYGGAAVGPAGGVGSVDGGVGVFDRAGSRRAGPVRSGELSAVGGSARGVAGGAAAASRRTVSMWPEPDGMARLEAYLPAADAQTVWLALDGLARADRTTPGCSGAEGGDRSVSGGGGEPDPVTGRRPPIDARRAD